MTEKELKGRILKLENALRHYVGLDHDRIGMPNYAARALGPKKTKDEVQKAVTPRRVAVNLGRLPE